MKTKLWLLAPLLIIVCSTAQADPRHFELSGEYRRHTGDYLYRHTHLSYRPTTDIHWPYSYEGDYLDGRVLEYGRTAVGTPTYKLDSRSLLIGFLKKKSPNYVGEVSLGFSHFYSEMAQIDRQSALIGRIKVKRKRSKKLNTSFQLDRDYLANRVELKTPEVSETLALTARVQMSYQRKEDRKFQYRGVFDWVKNGDLISSNDLQWMKGISMSDKWFWAGAGVQFIHHKKTNALYWSPKRFIAFGPRAELSWPLKKRLNGFLSGNLNWFKEQDFDNGIGSYIAVGAQYGDRESRHLRLQYETISSQQGDAEWGSDGWRLSYFHPF